jgi:hypothetical protein
MKNYKQTLLTSHQIDGVRIKDDEQDDVASFTIGIGVPVKVSVSTLDKVYDYNWSVNAKGYAYRMSGGKCIFMHRAVLDFELPDGWYIDHINGETLDNRLENLRAVKQQQNTMNRGRSTGKYKGVHEATDKPRTNRFKAQIKIDQKSHHIGYYLTEEEAARAYDERAKFFFGEYAQLNFPSERHPITHANLLRALPEQYAIGHDGALWACDEDGEMVDIEQCIIPLSYRTIEDIPENDPCWEQLCKVFDLV